MKAVRRFLWIIATVIIAALVFAPAMMALYDTMSFSGSEKMGKSFYVKGGETSPVLDPSLFQGQTRQAYAIAKEYPDLLDEIHCYCYCDETQLNHRSLLSCFTNKHGAGCVMGQDEVLRVSQLHKEGKSIKEIKRAIDREFGW